VGDGLNNWDGTEYHYFHSGGKGNHSGWGTYARPPLHDAPMPQNQEKLTSEAVFVYRRLFDYGKWEVLRFLMSNLKWFVDEYKYAAPPRRFSQFILNWHWTDSGECACEPGSTASGSMA